MKIYLVANLDQDWGINIDNAYSNKSKAEERLKEIQSEHYCNGYVTEYFEICELRLIK